MDVTWDSFCVSLNPCSDLQNKARQDFAALGVWQQVKVVALVVLCSLTVLGAAAAPYLFVYTVTDYTEKNRLEKELFESSSPASLLNHLFDQYGEQAKKVYSNWVIKSALKRVYDCKGICHAFKEGDEKSLREKVRLIPNVDADQILAFRSALINKFGEASFRKQMEVIEKVAIDIWIDSFDQFAKICQSDELNEKKVTQLLDLVESRLPA